MLQRQGAILGQTVPQQHGREAGEERVGEWDLGQGLESFGDTWGFEGLFEGDRLLFPTQTSFSFSLRAERFQMFNEMLPDLVLAILGLTSCEDTIIGNAVIIIIIIIIFLLLSLSSD